MTQFKRKKNLLLFDMLGDISISLATALGVGALGVSGKDVR